MTPVHAQILPVMSSSCHPAATGSLVVPSSALKKKEADYLVYVVHREEAKPAKEEVKKEGNELWGKLFKKKEGKKEEPSGKEEAAKVGTDCLKICTLPQRSVVPATLIDPLDSAPSAVIT